MDTFSHSRSAAIEALKTHSIRGPQESRQMFLRALTMPEVMYASGEPHLQSRAESRHDAAVLNGGVYGIRCSS